MTVTTGTRIGGYLVTGKLGQGGMGEVWRATDPRLRREVAIKLLPAVFSSDRERLARFEREAQVLAQLHHPHIASIFGVEESEEGRALVMELVEGEDLAQVLARGPLPVDETVAIARQVAEALQFAHEQGIVHRDLKPANVKARPDGTVKVLDFGLAKALDPAAQTARAASGSGGSANTEAHPRGGDGSGGSAGRRQPPPEIGLANSPTLTSAGTQLGVVLGTAAYMSPEQAKGRPADKRSDVWAFGCLLFEMLAGRRAFTGEDSTEVLAAVLRGEPEWGALPPDVPPQVRTLIERCLVKDRARRLPDMAVASFLLAEPEALAPAVPAATVTPAAPPARRLRGWHLAAAAALAALLTLGGVALLRPASAGAPARASHLSVVLPEGEELASDSYLPIALSADGAQVAYVATREGKSRLALRALDDPQTRILEGTDGARTPFFSPDGQWIGFFAEGKLKKVSTSGAAVQVLADAPDGRGGCFGSDGNAYFAPTNISGIWRVPAAGGTAVEVTHLDHAHGEISERWPQLLADGKTLLFTSWTGPGEAECAVIAQVVGTPERRVLMRAADSGHYLAREGVLLYGHRDDLLAIPWRPSQAGGADGVPLLLGEHPRMDGEGGSAFAVAEDGTLAFVAGGPFRYANRLVWVDRTGKVEALPVPERFFQSVSIAPDGTHAMVQIEEDTVALWALDLVRDTLTPFAAGGSSQAPVWTPDSRRVVYRGTRGGQRNLFWRAADGTGDEERLTSKPDVTQTPTAVSPDGHWLLFQEQGAAKRESRLWRLRLDGDRVPAPLHAGGEPERNAQLSPDGRWLAYESPVSGRFEVYVEPFPPPGARQQVSIDGGTLPLWSRDGRELYYRNGDHTMVVAAAGQDFSAAAPRLLYDGRFVLPVNWNTPYALARDGRFLRIQRTQPERPVVTIDVVQGWLGELAALRQGKSP